MLLYKGQVSEKITGKAAQKDPYGCSRHIVAHETGIVHSSHSGYERSKCADHRHEAGNEDGLLPCCWKKAWVFSRWLWRNNLESGRLNSFSPKCCPNR